ncbi:uncharacterized protein PHACADRAFT_261286, partial [Phanerochaete carnosa HHB-10118-sp]
MHTISFALPRLVPGSDHRLTVLSFSNVHLSSTTEISRLVDRLPTVRCCICQDVIFEHTSFTSRPRPRILKRHFEVISSRCTIVQSPANKTPIACDIQTPSALLVTLQCPANDSDVWVRAVSLLSRLFPETQYDYDVGLRYVPAEGTFIV